MPLKFKTETLGCKVNQYETQAMETLLMERGHVPVSDGETPDVIIINTCAVTAESGRKSRQAIRRAKKDAPDAIMCICGCYSQISPEDVASLGADLVAGSADRRAFVDDIEKLLSERTQIIRVDNALRRRTFEELPSGSLGGRTRAMLKIQDGCTNFCTYCVIPYSRGPVRSMPLE
ncbi:MAG: tRNA (N(6)-L-threonylcarbamoyladenosine(37)-C(2))-methylthiotransferase MtaB, partial [Oscillospiraceae bacterium]|nr:tRNA (N(6)-L-threonylcarbamoyladenosine(37)-C(2))-methylthiotransferase MtaB [Oscillospiraceae bacterium]